MYWNYRIVNVPSQNSGEDFFALQEVFYDDDNSLMGFAEPSTGTEDRDGLLNLADWIASAFSKPVLHENDFKYEGETK